MDNYTLIFSDACYPLPLSVASTLGNERQKITLIALTDETRPSGNRKDMEYPANVLLVPSLRAFCGLDDILADSLAVAYFDGPSSNDQTASPNLQHMMKISCTHHVHSLVVGMKAGDLAECSAWVKLPTIVGPGCTSNLVYRCLSQLFQGCSTIELPEAGEAEQSFLHVTDAAAGIARLLRHAEYVGESYEFGSNRASVSSVMRFLLFHLGLEDEITVRYNANESGKLRLPAEQHQKSVEQLGFRPRFSLRKGLAMTVDWFESSFGPILPKVSALSAQS